MPPILPNRFYQARGSFDPAGVTGVTIDPATVSPDASLSNGNLTISSTGSANNTERSTVGHSNGLYYYEFTIGQANNTGLGITTGIYPITNYLGQSGGSYGLYGGGWAGGGGDLTNPSFVAGHVYGVATKIDNTNGACYLWFKDLTAAGNWNADVSSNPVTPTGGRVVLFTIGDPLYAAVTCSSNGDNITFNFGGSTYFGTPPAGFGNW